MDLLRRRFHSEQRLLASARETLAVLYQTGVLARRCECRPARETLTALSPEQVRRHTRHVFIDLLKPPLCRNNNPR